MPRILFLLEDYNYFYTREGQKLLSQGKNYSETLQLLLSQKYYQSDSMAKAFEKLGHKTDIIVPESNPLQLQWLRENNKTLLLKWKFQKPLRTFKARAKKQYRTAYNNIHFDVLKEQVSKIKPSVIYVYSNIYLTEAQVKELKRHCKKIVLQWTTPLWREHPEFPYHAFDLIVTAALQLKEYFDSKKIPCVYLQQAFDDSILDMLEKEPAEKKDLVFIGGFSLGHNYRFGTLEYLLKNNINLAIYGMGKETLDKNSLTYKNMRGPLFGLDMYNEYRKYKMALHIHTTGKEADEMDWNKYAGAKRLFEITGSGTLLLTSQQENIKDLFEIGEEVITFTSPEELVSKIKTLLDDPEKIRVIAQKGQQRTLRDHSFSKRAGELSAYLFTK
jgi:glycosyltransferase involved in cell wall biosynthesis